MAHVVRIGVPALVMALAAGPAFADDPRLVGEWRAVTYHLDGRDVPMEGLFLFTARYFSSNVLFDLTPHPIDESNANAGPYTSDGHEIVFSQWVQIHLRPGDEAEPIFSQKGVDERAAYRFDGDRLVITFPSGNWYVLERIE